MLTMMRLAFYDGNGLELAQSLMYYQTLSLGFLALLYLTIAAVKD